MPKKNQTSFKKGQSGNPRGRPKKEHSLTNLLEEYLETKDKKSKKTRKELLIEKTMELALAGDATVLKYIYDRLNGMPGRSIDVKANVTHNFVIDIEEGEEED